jgi:two-component system, LuxR family, response regulator FixJ
MATMNSNPRKLFQAASDILDCSEHAIVHIVDDESEVRESLAELLHSIGLSVSMYASAEEFLDRYVPSTLGCLLIDVCMPGMSGLELQQQLAERQLSIPWVVITAHANVPMAVQAMSRGACGFLEKPYRSHELLELIKKAIERNRATRGDELRRHDVLARFEQLSPRERQVMEMVTAGTANKHIACKLGISERTVEVHRAKVMKKLAATTLVDLVQLANEYRAFCASDRCRE